MKSVAIPAAILLFPSAAFAQSAQTALTDVTKTPSQHEHFPLPYHQGFRRKNPSKTQYCFDLDRGTSTQNRS